MSVRKDYEAEVAALRPLVAQERQRAADLRAVAHATRRAAVFDVKPIEAARAEAKEATERKLEDEKIWRASQFPPSKAVGPPAGLSVNGQVGADVGYHLQMQRAVYNSQQPMRALTDEELMPAAKLQGLLLTNATDSRLILLSDGNRDNADVVRAALSLVDAVFNNQMSTAFVTPSGVNYGLTTMTKRSTEVYLSGSTADPTSMKMRVVFADGGVFTDVRPIARSRNGWLADDTVVAAYNKNGEYVSEDRDSLVLFALTTVAQEAREWIDGVRNPPLSTTIRRTRDAEALEVVARAVVHNALAPELYMSTSVAREVETEWKPAVGVDWSDHARWVAEFH